jgi:hypothetical protein
MGNISVVFEDDFLFDNGYFGEFKKQKVRYWLKKVVNLGEIDAKTSFEICLQDAFSILTRTSDSRQTQAKHFLVQEIEFLFSISL